MGAKSAYRNFRHEVGEFGDRISEGVDAHLKANVPVGLSYIKAVKEGTRKINGDVVEHAKYKLERDPENNQLRPQARELVAAKVPNTVIEKRGYTEDQVADAAVEVEALKNQKAVRRALQRIRLAWPMQLLPRVVQGLTQLAVVAYIAVNYVGFFALVWAPAYVLRLLLRGLTYPAVEKNSKGEYIEQEYSVYKACEEELTEDWARELFGNKDDRKYYFIAGPTLLFITLATMAEYRHKQYNNSIFKLFLVQPIRYALLLIILIGAAFNTTVYSILAGISAGVYTLVKGLPATTAFVFDALMLYPKNHALSNRGLNNKLVLSLSVTALMALLSVATFGTNLIALAVVAGSAYLASIFLLHPKLAFGRRFSLKGTDQIQNLKDHDRKTTIYRGIFLAISFGLVMGLLGLSGGGAAPLLAGVLAASLLSSVPFVVTPAAVGFLGASVPMFILPGITKLFSRITNRNKGPARRRLLDPDASAAASSSTPPSTGAQPVRHLAPDPDGEYGSVSHAGDGEEGDYQSLDSVAMRRALTPAPLIKVDDGAAAGSTQQMGAMESGSVGTSYSNVAMELGRQGGGTAAPQEDADGPSSSASSESDEGEAVRYPAPPPIPSRPAPRPEQAQRSSVGTNFLSWRPWRNSGATSSSDNAAPPLPAPPPLTVPASYSTTSTPQ